MRKKVHSDVFLNVHSLGAGGDGVATHEGVSVYLPKTAPGDRVCARIERFAEGYQGRVLAIEISSPDRVAAPCRHYESCGGCALQHLSVVAYRDWKAEKVKVALERAGVIPEVWEEPVFLDAATRRRTTLAVLRTSDQFYMGYHAPRSHQITPVSHCLILEPSLDQVVQAMRPFLERLAPLRHAVDVTVQSVEGRFDVLLTGPWRSGGFFTLEQNEALSEMLNTLGLARISLREREHGTIEVLLTRQPVMKTFGVLRVPLPPGAFLQASEQGEAVLVERVLRYMAGATRIADLFCGCGTFTGALLGQEVEVYACDSDAVALAGLKHPKLTAARRNLFKEPLSIKELPGFDVVVLDPPRAGAKEQVEIFAESGVMKIVYVSCNPSTFARDAKILAVGGYRLLSLALVDQFVWSAHTEIVGVFTLI
ncbi:MAG: class I SAM-dependent RNA methyltransferase [Alphaproteobacteria bacterium]|nr:class I SAM-dependent RNA methyltransferase [Alphaproteobacteria bacterium]MBP7761820.1 class I SAM-dependent RNA methyltransferase [Alphaproteobacteria bacterium]